MPSVSEPASGALQDASGDLQSGSGDLQSGSGDMEGASGDMGAAVKTASGSNLLSMELQIAIALGGCCLLFIIAYLPSYHRSRLRQRQRAADQSQQSASDAIQLDTIRSGDAAEHAACAAKHPAVAASGMDESAKPPATPVASAAGDAREAAVRCSEASLRSMPGHRLEESTAASGGSASSRTPPGTIVLRNSPGRPTLAKALTEHTLYKL